MLQLWKNEAEFCAFFTKIIADAPFNALYWETPPITKENVHRYFEMVLIQSRSLEKMTPESHVFKQYFDEKSRVAVFPNLGKNAMLIVPKPISTQDNFAHLAAFIQNAREDQIHEFWQRLAMAIEENLNEKPMWVSTAGNGVYWLHVRLDTRPKYYKYSTYRTI